MESARDIHTGEIIDAEQLWHISPIDPKGYKCRGCGVLVCPCSYRPENKVRPYFSAKEGHKIGCDVDGEMELVRRAKKERVTTSKGFPGSFPNRLELKDVRSVVAANSSEITKPLVANKYRNTADNSLDNPIKNHSWAASTIRPICRTFLRFPHDRDLPLKIPEILAYTYQYIFQVLRRENIIPYSKKRLFYAPISWITPTSNDEQLEIKLNYGDWEDEKLTHPYRVRVNWKDWSTAKRNYVMQEIEIARIESIAANKKGVREKGWLFFIGRQDDVDLALFHVDDYRLLCCLVAEIIYPKWGAKKSR